MPTQTQAGFGSTGMNNMFDMGMGSFGLGGLGLGKNCFYSIIDPPTLLLSVTLCCFGVLCSNTYVSLPVHHIIIMFFHSDV